MEDERMVLGNRYLLKLIFVFIVFITSIAFSWGKGQSSKIIFHTPGWHDATPDNYSVMERLFLKYRCHPVLQVAYIYNIDAQHWLTYSEARQKYPDLARALGGGVKSQQFFDKQKSHKLHPVKDCEIGATKTEVEQALSVNLTGFHGDILLFIDNIHDDNGRAIWEKAAFKSFKKSRDKNLAIAASDKRMPHFLIHPPVPKNH